MAFVVLELHNRFDKILVPIVVLVATQIIDCHNVQLAL